MILGLYFSEDLKKKEIQILFFQSNKTRHKWVNICSPVKSFFQKEIYIWPFVEKLLIVDLCVLSLTQYKQTHTRSCHAGHTALDWTCVWTLFKAPQVSPGVDVLTETQTTQSVIYLTSPVHELNISSTERWHCHPVREYSTALKYHLQRKQMIQYPFTLIINSSMCACYSINKSMKKKT